MLCVLFVWACCVFILFLKVDCADPFQCGYALASIMCFSPRLLVKFLILPHYPLQALLLTPLDNLRIVQSCSSDLGLKSAGLAACAAYIRRTSGWVLALST